eukprot:GDKJ01043643.1.p1 GENE.GDKJ01043643.1~~GDKJ01043643.1.p1  ORF type:complete len:541 (-),score=84.99 GDKJ01043643.1:194-1816(-)
MATECHHGPALYFPDFKESGHLCGCSFSKDGRGCPQFIEHHLNEKEYLDVCSTRYLKFDIPSISETQVWERLAHVRPPWIYGIDPEAPDLPSHEIMATINGTTYESITEGGFPRYFITENSIKDYIFWILKQKYKRIVLINMPGLHEALQLLKWTGQYCGIKIEDRTCVPVSFLLDADDRLNAYFDDAGYSEGREIGSLPDPSKSKKARAERAKVTQRLGGVSVSHQSYLRVNLANLCVLPCRSQKEIYDGPVDASLGAEGLSRITREAHQKNWPLLCELLASCDALFVENYPGMRFEFFMHSLYKVACIRSSLSSLSGSSGRVLPPVFFSANPMLSSRISAEAASLQKNTNCKQAEFHFLDFPVHYVGNPFKTQRRRAKGGNENSPMRLFTNEKASLFLPPTGQEDKFKWCEPCERWSRQYNKHCDKCKTCVSTDCMVRNHCDKCATCVPATFHHCEKCEKCVSRDHKCSQTCNDSEDEEEEDNGNVEENKIEKQAAAAAESFAAASSSDKNDAPVKMSRRYKKSLAKRKKSDSVIKKD